MKRIIICLLVSVLATNLWAGDVKIKITGTLEEPVVMTIGDRVETINELPFVFKIDKKTLPQKGKFTSANYTYKDIVFNKNEEDGRVYVLHSSEKAVGAPIQYANAALAPSQGQTSQQKTIDRTIDVNNVPTTGLKSENTFALIIANEDYESASHVDMALNDGQIFKEYCSKTLGIPETCIKHYENATYGQFTKALKNIQDIAAAYNGDINLIIFYAGHGIPDNATQTAYLMPIDADGTDLEICFSLDNLYKKIDQMNLSQTVVFLDACFSGSKRNGGMIVAARGVAIKPKASKPNGTTIVFSATSGEEAAYSYKEKQHGLFSYFLLKKLQETKGTTTLGELIDDVTTHVKQNSVVVNGTIQTPGLTVGPALVDNWRNLKLSR